MKIGLSVALFLSALFALSGQNMIKAVHLNHQEQFRGKLPVLEVLETHTDLPGKKQTQTHYYFDTSQKLYLTTLSENGMLLRKDSMTYYFPGGLKKATISESWDASQNYDRKIENYVYDMRGFIVRIREFDKDGYLKYESRFKNMGLGRPYLLDKFDAGENPLGATEIAEYLPETNRYIIKMVNIMDKEISRDTFVYDLSLSAKYPGKGETYNEQGDLVKLVNPEHHTSFFEYRYDAQGNWVEKKRIEVELEKGKEKKVPVEKWERHFTYGKP